MLIFVERLAFFSRVRATIEGKEHQFGLREFCHSFHERIEVLGYGSVRVLAYPELRLKKNNLPKVR